MSPDEEQVDQQEHSKDTDKHDAPCLSVGKSFHALAQSNAQCKNAQNCSGKVKDEKERLEARKPVMNLLLVKKITSVLQKHQ